MTVTKLSKDNNNTEDRFIIKLSDKEAVNLVLYLISAQVMLKRKIPLVDMIFDAKGQVTDPVTGQIVDLRCNKTNA